MRNFYNKSSHMRSRVSKNSSNMKSNMGVQSKCQSSETEGRLFPRRKVASKPLLLNGSGDFDMELSLAIQESLKYAAQEKEEESKNNAVNAEPELEDQVSGSSEFKPQPTASCDTENKKWAEEVTRLKDLLLAQAELIQCQQEEINIKDKEIIDLIAGKDALQCRLERMERRMSLLKHKEDGQEEAFKTDDSSSKATVLSTTNHNVQTTSDQKGKCELNSDIKRKRRRNRNLNFSQKKCHKYRRLLLPSESVSEKEESGLNDDSDDNSDEEVEENKSRTEEEVEEKDDEPHLDDSSEEIEENIIDYSFLQTDTLYHLYYPKHVFASLDTDTVAERLKAQLEVETPTWRLKTFSNMYQLEGTENITDEAYYKRHQKFEVEEKRRKRWDLQRMRELQVFENLQRQKEDEIQASQDEADVETFLPSVQKLKYIEVTDSLPVMAFGQPLPYISPGEFELPWEVPSSTSTALPSNKQKSLSSHSRRH